MFTIQKIKTEKRASEYELLEKKLEKINKELTNSATKILQTSEFLQSTQK